MLRRSVNTHGAMTLFSIRRPLTLAFLAGPAGTACGATSRELLILQADDVVPSALAQGAAK
jgi:hypothetical protein